MAQKKVAEKDKPGPAARYRGRPGVRMYRARRFLLGGEFVVTLLEGADWATLRFDRVMEMYPEAVAGLDVELARIEDPFASDGEVRAALLQACGKPIPARSERSR